MDKWKIGVIALLLCALVGYGVTQNQGNSGDTKPQESPEGHDDTAPTTTASPQAQSTPPLAAQAAAALRPLMNHPAPGWMIKPEYWANTPKPLTLKDIKGHVTLLEFWRSTCPHCEQATPFMKRIYELYSQLGLKVITFHSSSPNVPEENDWNL